MNLDALIERVHEAQTKHGPFADGHHAYGVLMEEVCEFFDSVRADSPDPEELLDIAVVAIRAWLQFSESLQRGVLGGSGDDR